MKKIAFAILFIVLGAGLALADLGVDREELKKAKDVNFVNYGGPYEKISTFDEIRNIGAALGKDFRKESFRATDGRFSIIHVYDPEDKSGRLDADIFVIEAGSFIGHVNSIRIIIAGYLQAAYGYSLDDARLLARFVTLYNAVFRGNVAYFGTVYKGKVMENVSAADAGLALVYSEWPGRTKVLIPLSEGFEKGKISSLDAQKLTEEEVKDTLRRDGDKGIEDRKKIVELQEKQIEEKEKDLKEAKKELADDKKELEEMKKELAEEKKKTGETESTRRKEEEIRKKEEEIKRDETEVARREADVKKSEETLRRDRDEIAKEDRGVTEKLATLDTVSAEKGTFLRVPDGSENESGEVVIYNFKDKAVVARTQGLRVKERRLHAYDNQLLVVAEADGTAGAYFIFLDYKTLAVSLRSKEEIFKNSVVTTQANALYAVVKQGGRYFIGKFDTTLSLVNKSAEEVNPYTPLHVAGGYLYVQARSGTILRLNANDLTTKDTAVVK